MSVFVCIPTARDIRSETTEAAFRICSGHGGGAEFRAVQTHPTDYARNQCVKLFLNSSHSHIFFLDSDVVPPDNVLDLMLATNRPLVCGIYPLMLAHSTICTSIAKRNANGTYEFLGDFPQEPFEADAGGMGCCLIARPVLEQMEFPWFKFRQKPDCMITGEDIYFFEKAAELGFKPLVIPKIQCSHFKTVDLLDVIRAATGNRRAAGRPAHQPEPVAT